MFQIAYNSGGGEPCAPRPVSLDFGINFHRGQAFGQSELFFLLLGSWYLVFSPALIESATDATEARAALLILGIVFLVLGLIALTAMIVDAILKSRAPHRREQWFYWSYAFIALFAAALFAIPATFVFPIALIAFFVRPNSRFPAGQTNTGVNIFVTCLFSISGLFALALLIFLARRIHREQLTIESS